MREKCVIGSTPILGGIIPAPHILSTLARRDRQQQNARYNTDHIVPARSNRNIRSAIQSATATSTARASSSTARNDAPGSMSAPSSQIGTDPHARGAELAIRSHSAARSTSVCHASPRHDRAARRSSTAAHSRLNHDRKTAPRNRSAALPYVVKSSPAHARLKIPPARGYREE